VRELLARVPIYVDDTERRALAMWLDGEKDYAIAEALGLASPKDAARLLHASRKRLRAHLALVVDEAEEPGENSFGGTC
jgi:hypothetical protein